MKRIGLVTLLALSWNASAFAYVEAPLSLGSVITQSSNIVVMTITAVDKEKNLIIYKKVQDLKGKHPQEVIKHNIGKAGLRPNEWKEIMDLAEVGKTVIFCHNGSASETYIGANWYQAYPRGEWWDMSHAEPFLLRSFSGKPEKFIGIINEIVANKEVIVPCMVDGNKEDLHFRRTLNVASGDFFRSFDFQHDHLRRVAVERDRQLLEIEDDVGDIFIDAGH